MFLNNIDNGDAVTVCFKNTYTPPVVPDPTFVKVKENTSYDATYAYWAIAIHNNQPGAVAQTGLVVTDTTYANAYVHAVSPPGSCAPSTGTGPWTCSVTAGGTTTLRLRVPLSSTPGSLCTGRELDNAATVVTAAGAQLSQTPGGAPDLDHISIPATADGGCITVEKSKGVANGNKVDWTVTFHNSGPPRRSP
ncbi:hypothetical protein [Candidatus Amarobacter glycogenicus]|uniref:hypothetical protein n=1 Tax=Candidatus Amarobacter glycogenicus TaxID=3140699 RepID=UPI003135592B|nr:hypothetical protein [Dehalococcoidia bacterium]